MSAPFYFQIDPSTKEFINESVYNAWYGFDKLGTWTEKFLYSDLDKLELTKDNIIVGGIKPIKETLIKLGIEPPPNIDYPDELKSFLGRNIWLSTIGEMRKMMVDDVMNPPIFIKPALIQKDFTGHVVAKYKDLIKTASFSSDYQIWISETLDFVSEYRYYVNRNEVIGVGFYKGNPLRCPHGYVVNQAVQKFKESAPISYCLDFGLNKQGNTFLIEVNDGFAFGSYGLNGVLHAIMLEDRWREIVDLPSLCRVR